MNKSCLPSLSSLFYIKIMYSDKHKVIYIFATIVICTYQLPQESQVSYVVFYILF